LPTLLLSPTARTIISPLPSITLDPDIKKGRAT